MNQLNKNIENSLNRILVQELHECRGLSPDAYTDADFFEVEREVILKSNWQCVGRAEELANPGDYLSLDLLGVPLLVTKNKAGEIQAMANVCQHRSAQLVEHGCGNKKAFSCPYHGWTYDSNGQLISVPLADGFCKLKKDEVHLQKFAVEIWEGFILVNFNSEAKSVSELLKPLAEAVAPWKLSEVKIVNSMVRKNLPFNWKVMTENFLEMYHVLYTHKNTLEPTFPTRDAYQFVTGEGFTTLGGKIAAEKDELFSLDLVTDPITKDSGHAFAIFPNFLFAVFPTNTTWVRIVPTSARTMDMELVTMQHPDFMKSGPEAEAEIKTWRDSLEIIQGEDEFVCEAVQKGLESGFGVESRIGFYDQTSYDFVKWYAEKFKAVM